jgi:PDZ domain
LRDKKNQKTYNQILNTLIKKAMEDLKTFLAIVVIATLGWHVKVGLSTDKKLSGIFQEKPELGYSWKKTNSNTGGFGITWSIETKGEFPQIQSVASGSPAERAGVQVNDFIIKIEGESIEGWTRDQIANAMIGQVGSFCSIVIWRKGTEIPVTYTRQKLAFIEDQERLNNAYNPTSHFFWEDNNVVWCPGFVHPTFNAQANTLKNTWTPLPGYVFTGTALGDLNTIWKQGLKHPSMNAWSISEEGKWMPTLGYKFIMENDLAVGTTWDAGKQYDNLKITAGDKQDTYYSYPGYTFRDPDKSLDVVWTPGQPNPDNPDFIAGTTEGSWEYKDPSVTTEPTTGEYFGRYLAGHAVAAIIEEIFGSNLISDKLHEESSIEGIKGVIQAIK